MQKDELVKAQSKAIDNILELQDNRALGTLMSIVTVENASKYDLTIREKAKEAMVKLAPYLNNEDLQICSEFLKYINADNKLIATVDKEVESRTKGGKQLQPDVSVIWKNYKDAGLAVLKTPIKMSEGFGRMVVDSPGKAPTRIVAGMVTGIYHAVVDIPDEIAGLATAGNYGSMGEPLGAQVTNTVLTLAPIVKAIKGRITTARAAKAANATAADTVAAKDFSAIQEGSQGNLTRLVEGKKPNWIKRQWDRLYYGAEVEYPDSIQGTKKVKGAVWHLDDWGKNVEGDVNLAYEDANLGHAFENKWTEAEFIQKHAPDAFPLTENFKAVIDKLNLKKPETMAERVQYLQTIEKALHEQYPDGFFLKGVKDYNTGGNLPTAKTNFIETYKGYLEKFVPLEETLKSDPTVPDPQVILKTNEFHAGRALQSLIDDPSTVIVQEKLALQKYTNATLPKHVQPFHEFRVHVADGKVIDGLTYHRWKLSENFTNTKLIKNIESWVQTQVDKFPVDVKSKLGFAPDIVILEDGSFKFIELNVGGNSGFLTNPISNYKLATVITGQNPTPLRVAKAIGTAGVMVAPLNIQNNNN